MSIDLFPTTPEGMTDEEFRAELKKEMDDMLEAHQLELDKKDKRIEQANQNNNKIGRHNKVDFSILDTPIPSGGRKRDILRFRDRRVKSHFTLVLATRLSEYADAGLLTNKLDNEFSEATARKFWRLLKAFREDELAPAHAIDSFDEEILTISGFPKI